ncbi:MAG: transcriptional regulator [Bacteroidota bacterium]
MKTALKEIIYALDQEFESRVRLGIMSILMVNDQVDFNRFKELLDTSDGNIASHLNSLEKVKYIQIKKQFIGRKPNTTYSATRSGKKAFEDHLKVLETLIKKKR